MRAYEFMFNEAQQLNVQPAAIQQNAKVVKMIGKMANSEKQLPPTEDEKVLAVMNYGKLKKQANKNYVGQLKRQLAHAASFQKIS